MVPVQGDPKYFFNNDYHWNAAVHKAANAVTKQRRDERVAKREAAANAIQRSYRKHYQRRVRAANTIQRFAKGKLARENLKMLKHARDVEYGYNAVLNERRFPTRRRLTSVTAEKQFWDRKYPPHHEEKRSYAWHVANSTKKRRSRNVVRMKSL